MHAQDGVNEEEKKNERSNVRERFERLNEGEHHSLQILVATEEFDKA